MPVLSTITSTGADSARRVAASVAVGVVQQTGLHHRAVHDRGAPAASISACSCHRRSPVTPIVQPARGPVMGSEDGGHVFPDRFRSLSIAGLPAEGARRRVQPWTW